MIALLVIIIVIFAIVGMMEGVFFLSILMQRSMQSHIHMLQKASLAEQFIVEDLCGTYSTQPSWLLTATGSHSHSHAMRLLQLKSVRTDASLYRDAKAIRFYL